MSMRRPGILAALLMACALGACSKGDGGVKDEELAGLVVAPPDHAEPVDPDKAAGDAVELDRAFAIRHHDVATALGAHTVTITSSYEVKEGDKVVDSLSDKTTLEVAADGTFHALYDNSADYGREVVFRDGMLYLRPRYARWHRRAPNDKHEVTNLLDQMYEVAGDYFDLVAHAAEVSDAGAAQVSGRDGRKVEIKLAPTAGKPAPQPLTQKKWRESVVVTALSGEAVLDADAAIPLQAKVNSTFGFSRDGRSFTMSIEVSQEISGIGTEVAVVTPPPEETVDTPQRQKEVDERDFLLDRIAPPAKKSGGTNDALPPQVEPPPAEPAPVKAAE
jgi:hypothetical protein